MEEKMSKVKFDGTRRMSNKEKEELINFIFDAQELYKKHDNKNRFLYDCFNAMIRPLSLNIGQYNNCKISRDAKKIIGEFRNIREFERKKTGKNIKREHVKPVKVLIEEFNQGFNNREDVKKWFDSCEIAFITENEDVEIKDAEKDIRNKKGFNKNNLSSKLVFDIHKEAYEITGLNKKLEKFEIIN